MAKIIKARENVNAAPFNISSFSTVERGEAAFVLTSFGAGEVSVQDEAFELSAKTKQTGSQRRSSLIPEYTPDESELTLNRPKNEFEEIAIPEEAAENVTLLQSQKETAEKNAELEALKNELEQVKSERDTLKAELEAMQTALPDAVESAKAEGRQEGLAESSREYEAKQNDYLSSLEKFYTEASAELKKLNDAVNEMDTQIPQIVLGYVREIVGKERVLNDDVVVNIVKSALTQLKELQNISFTVNPDDLNATKTSFPEYEVTGDPSVAKGAVTIRTKIGELDFSADSWLKNLEKQINEKLGTA